MVNRRDFLKYMGAGAVAAGTTGISFPVFGQAKRAIPTTPIKVAAVSF